MRWVVGAVAGFGRLPDKVVRMEVEDGVEAEPGGRDVSCGRFVTRQSGSIFFEDGFNVIKQKSNVPSPNTLLSFLVAGGGLEPPTFGL